MLKELTEPVEISDLELTKFWGADVARLNTYQRALIAEVYTKVKKPLSTLSIHPTAS